MQCSSDGNAKTSKAEELSKEFGFDIRNIPNMTKQEILDAANKDWDRTERNGFIHIREMKENGKKDYRIRIDPPDNTTTYPHVHIFDKDKNLLDISGNIVKKNSPDGHIPYKF